MKKQIMLRCVLIAAVSALIVFFAALGVVYGVSDKRVRENLVSDAKVYCDMLSNAEAESVLGSVKDFGGMRITLMDDQGNVLFESDTSDTLSNHADREEVKAALDGSPKIVQRYSDTMQYNMYYYALTYKFDGRTYVLRIAERQSDMASYVWISLPFVLLAVIIAVAVSYFSARRLSGRMSQKLRDVGDSIKSLNDGQYRPIQTDMSDTEFFGILTEMNDLFDSVQSNMAAIKDEQIKLDIVINNISQGVIAFSAKNDIVLVNKFVCELFGVDSGSTKGQNLLWLVDDKELCALLEDAVSGGSDREFNFRYKDKDLNFKVFCLKNSGLSNDIGNIALIADLTNEKIALRQKSEFFANASHELKTPLTSMQGLTELLLAKGGDEQQQKYLQRIYAESKRLGNLVLDMLYISDLENGRTVRNEEEVDLISVANEVRAEYAHQAEEKNVDITVSGDGKIRADYRSVYEIVGNLCSNAVHYNKEGGKVDISVSDIGGKVKLQVRDTGIGIAAEHLPKLCERFYRVDKSRSKKTGGTGLGLAIVKHVCNLYGAKLDIQSEVGKGTCVSIEFNK